MFSLVGMFALGVENTLLFFPAHYRCGFAQLLLCNNYMHRWT